MVEGLSGIGQIPEDACHMCMEKKEIMMQSVSYPYSYSQRKICSDCKDKLVIAITKALDSVRW